MSIEVKMPALSPTMETGKLARWLVKQGDRIAAGDVIAEIETDKATMELEAADEGVLGSLVIAEGSEDIPVGTVIAIIDNAAENGVQEAVAAAPPAPAVPEQEPERPVPPAEPAPAASAHLFDPPAPIASGAVKISPLAARVARANAIDTTALSGSGPGGKIMTADLGLKPLAKPEQAPAVAVPSATPVHPIADVPHELTKLSSMRRTIARRLTESKQQIPHIYLTVDIRLDALLALRSQINDALEPRGLKASVNDLIIKALALALTEVPVCNAQFAGDHLARFSRADISVAVSIPNGLITPIIVDAASKSISTIAGEMKDLASRARAGKLQPSEYQGGTASLSNLGMFGIKQFEAVINPPQAMIMAVGTAEKRTVVFDDEMHIATVLTATGSFDHRAIDGADAAALMHAFRRLIENPLELVA